MQIYGKKITAYISVSLILFGMFRVSVSNAAEIDDSPSAGAMMADLLIARPLLLTGTVLGTAVYVVSLPFTLLGGNASEAGEALVLEPMEATFARCLGCTGSDHNNESIKTTTVAGPPSDVDLSQSVVSTEESFPIYRPEKERIKPFLKAGYQAGTYFGESDSSTSGFLLAFGSTVVDGDIGYLDIELSYADYGNDEFLRSDPGEPRSTITHNLTSVAAGVNAGIHLGSRGYLYGKVGYSSWTLRDEQEDTDPNDPFTSKEKEEGNDFYYGAGIGIDLTQKINLNVEYVVHPISELQEDDNNVTAIGANLSFKI